MSEEVVISDTWSSEEVEHLISDSIDMYLKDQVYSDADALKWNNLICEEIISRLVATKKPYKYCVDCLIIQRIGSGLHSHTSSYFDTTNDGQITYQWPKDKSKDQPNKTMNCLVTVFGASV